MLLNLLHGNTDIASFIKEFLLNLPAFVLALTMHEAAHAYAAWKCGDPTARMMGRMTLNPLKHLDPRGFLFMFIAGVGWAKPVPVNPRNFRRPRRDDLMVALAGITMNLILFIVSTLAMYAFVTAALSVHRYSSESVQIAYTYAYNMQSYLIEPELGPVCGWIFQFFADLAIVDISLALFNLLPIPPLDGYHVFNDIILKGRNLFPGIKIQQIGMLIILVLMFTGLFDKAFSFLVSGAFQGIGSLFYTLARAAGAA